MEAGEIRNILQRHAILVEHVRGVFARDQLPEHLPPGGYIVNTDNADGPGIHWVALWVEEDSVEFMDSFAHDPEYYGWSFSLSLLMNARQLQSDNAITCGAYCLYFLYFRALGLSMETILEFFSVDTRLNDLHVSRFVALL